MGDGISLNQAMASYGNTEKVKSFLKFMNSIHCRKDLIFATFLFYDSSINFCNKNCKKE